MQTGINATDIANASKFFREASVPYAPLLGNKTKVYSAVSKLDMMKKDITDDERHKNYLVQYKEIIAICDNWRDYYGEWMINGTRTQAIIQPLMHYGFGTHLQHADLTPGNATAQWLPNKRKRSEAGDAAVAGKLNIPTFLHACIPHGALLSFYLQGEADR